MSDHRLPLLKDVSMPLAPTSSPAQSLLRDGRIFGAVVLAAFLLYGIGSSMADQLAGAALVGLNSIAVTIVGVIGFRLLRSSAAVVGALYLVTRVVEAALLFGGVALVAFADSTDADNTGYLLGMIVLGLGSIPFFCVLGRDHHVPRWLAWWGVAGYALLALGALIELALDQQVAIYFAALGGLFELTLGIWLLRRGFQTTMCQTHC